MKKRCVCEDWLKLEKNIRNGLPYTHQFFIYCPFCNEPLKGEKHEVVDKD